MDMRTEQPASPRPDDDSRRRATIAPSRIAASASGWTLACIIAISLAILPHLLGRGAEPTSGQSPTAPPATRPTTGPTTNPTEQLKVGVQSFVRLDGREGFWRVGKTADDVWWFVSPENTVEFMNTVTTVQPFQIGRLVGGPQYSSTDWNGGTDSSSGDLNAWATKTLARVRAAGFKGLGAWCNPVFHNLDVPMTRDLNLWAHTDITDARLYSANWRSVIEDAVRRQVEPLRDNKNLVGYYTDNELDWSDNGAGPAMYFDHLPPADANRQKVIATIQSIWPDVIAFNTAWNTTLASYADLEALPALPHEPADAYGKLLDVWLKQLALDYFTTTSSLIRQYDPNHLILGVRFKGSAPEEVVAAARGLTDAVSINYYPSDAKLDADLFPMITHTADQPVIITEYSFHALDGRSGNRNTFGFNAQVPDQEARAEGYRLFTQRLARTPFIIGADWFQWMDEPPSGRALDGEDVNFGVVDVDDRPYEALEAAIQETTPTLNALHAQSPTDLRTDVSREKFSEKVVADVPYLETPIRINGELSDWPKSAKISGMRHSQTVGLERSPLPLPNIYMAWNEAGLYFGAEVFDNDIEAAPADGWWWTRDALELFISTKRPDEGQNFYTPHDHQFFYVPIAFPGADGSAGTVGRWHRQGDGLKTSIIPDREIRQASRVFPGRYVVEMFIPASELHGYDPTGVTPMALNVCVKNFQTAIEYFWSAPKQVQTHLRPGTWGLLNRKPKVEPNLATGG